MENIENVVKKFDQNIRIIGMGSESITLNLESEKTEKHKDIVLKVNREYMANLCFSFLEESSKYDLTTENVIKEYKEKIKFNKDLEKELFSIFGDSLQSVRIFEKKLRITSDIIWKILKNHFPNGNSELEKSIKDQNIDVNIPVLFEVQKKSQELVNREKSKINNIDVDLLTRTSLIDIEDNERKEDIGRSVERQVEDYYDNLNDEEKEVYKDLILKLIEYTKKTGYILDIFGPDNFFLYRDGEDKKTKLKIIDPILPAYNRTSKININNDAERKYFRQNYTYYSFLRKNLNVLNLDMDFDLDHLSYFNKKNN